MRGTAYSSAQAEASFERHWRIRDQIEGLVSELNELEPILKGLRDQGYRPDHEIQDGSDPDDVPTGGTWELMYR
jgi:hypothetical protein